MALLVLKWFSNLGSCPNWGQGEGGGLGNSGNAQKKKFFFPLMSSFSESFKNNFFPHRGWEVGGGYPPFISAKLFWARFEGEKHPAIPSKKISAQ